MGFLRWFSIPRLLILFLLYYFLLRPTLAVLHLWVFQTFSWMIP